MPVYERTGSVTTNMQRRFVWQALEQLPAGGFDPVPEDILKRERWPERNEALRHAHFPPSDASVDDLNNFMTAAQRRLVFEDFFVFQTGLALRRQENAQVRKLLVSKVDDRIRQRSREVLPFKLTAGQRDALLEIVTDMQKAWPMQRLLQGDVGAGKTIVRAARRRGRDRERLSSGRDGADGDPCRAVVDSASVSTDGTREFLSLRAQCLSRELHSAAQGSLLSQDRAM